MIDCGCLWCSCAGVRKTGDSLISLEQGESAFKSIQNSVKQLEEDVKDSNRRGDLAGVSCAGFGKFKSMLIYSVVGATK